MEGKGPLPFEIWIVRCVN